MKKLKGSQRYFIKVIYQGTAYCGWQKQPKQSTVQGSLETSFAQVGVPASLVGSGRTDAGVHALGQIAHLDLPLSTDVHALKKSLNAVLPHTIAIDSFQKVIPEAHARFHAVGRKYQYTIATTKNPFHYQRSYYYPSPLDIDGMNDMAQALLGKQDFTSFCKANADVPHHICEVTEAYWERKGRLLSFFIKANRFLHNMVRTTVGTMLTLARAKKGNQALRAILQEKDRRKAGFNAPPEGLFLLQVDYPSTVFQCD